MVKEIYDEAGRSTFEDVECRADPMYPRDNACNSVEDDDNSDDEEIKELYANPGPSARMRVQDI